MTTWNFEKVESVAGQATYGPNDAVLRVGTGTCFVLPPASAIGTWSSQRNTHLRLIDALFNPNGLK